MPPLLTIITVNLNHADGLANTLQTVVSQSQLEDVEWILVDGASTDNSMEVANEFRDRFRHFISEPDQGVYDAMNKGLALASGTYITFLNSGDTLPHSGLLAEVLPSLAESDASLVYGNSNRKQADGTWKEAMQPSNLQISRFFGHGICHQTVYFHRRLFDELGSFDLQYPLVADWHFLLKTLIIPSTRTLHLNFPVVNYEGDGLSARLLIQLQTEKDRMLKSTLPEAVYRDALEKVRLEKETLRLLEVSTWVDQIRDRGFFINLAMILKWCFSKKGGST